MGQGKDLISSRSASTASSI